MASVQEPKISVCIPVFNREDYIGDALSSVLEQDFKDFEVIVVDNHSNDNTRDIVTEYCKKDSRFILYENTENIGMVGNFNRCLEYARGEYLKFLCSDDLFLDKGALGRFYALAESAANVSLVASGRNILRSNGSFLRPAQGYSGVFWCQGKEIINDCLLSGRNKIGEPTAVMFPKKLVERGLDQRYKQILDLEFWFYLLEKGNFVYTEEALVGFRSHSNQATKVNMMSEEYLEDTPLLYEKYLDKEYLSYDENAKRFMWLSYCRSLWKLYKNGRLSEKIARNNVEKYFGYYSFIFFLPFYSILKRIYRKRHSIYKNDIA
jgi:glycosyltransferase involved in cell wall biosynthesis